MKKLLILAYILIEDIIICEITFYIKLIIVLIEIGNLGYKGVKEGIVKVILRYL